jgi:hypothetical protein
MSGTEAARVAEIVFLLDALPGLTDEQESFLRARGAKFIDKLGRRTAAAMRMVE